MFMTLTKNAASRPSSATGAKLLSPGRQAWVDGEDDKPRRGRHSNQHFYVSPLPGLCIISSFPSAHALGSIISRLRRSCVEMTSMLVTRLTHLRVQNQEISAFIRANLR